MSNDEPHMEGDFSNVSSSNHEEDNVNRRKQATNEFKEDRDEEVEIFEVRGGEEEEEEGEDGEDCGPVQVKKVSSTTNSNRRRKASRSSKPGSAKRLRTGGSKGKYNWRTEEEREQYNAYMRIKMKEYSARLKELGVRKMSELSKEKRDEVSRQLRAARPSFPAFRRPSQPGQSLRPTATRSPATPSPNRRFPTIPTESEVTDEAVKDETPTSPKSRDDMSTSDANHSIMPSSESAKKEETSEFDDDIVVLDDSEICRSRRVSGQSDLTACYIDSDEEESPTKPENPRERSKLLEFLSEPTLLLSMSLQEDLPPLPDERTNSMTPRETSPTSEGYRSDLDVLVDPTTAFEGTLYVGGKKKKPYKCDWTDCTKSYTDPSSLCRHKRKVHGYNPIKYGRGKYPRKKNGKRQSSVISKQESLDDEECEVEIIESPGNPSERSKLLEFLCEPTLLISTSLQEARIQPAFLSQSLESDLPGGSARAGDDIKPKYARGKYPRKPKTEQRNIHSQSGESNRLLESSEILGAEEAEEEANLKTPFTGRGKYLRKKNGGVPRNPPRLNRTPNNSTTSLLNQIPRLILSDVDKITMRAEEQMALKNLNLHFAGKVYRLATQGTVDESGGRDFVREIEDRKREMFCDWMLREQEFLMAGQQYSSDFIIGCTAYDGVWNEVERERKVKILVKHTDFPRGRWEEYSTLEDRAACWNLRSVQEWRWREAVVSQVREVMRTECEDVGENFDEIYPEVFLCANNQLNSYENDKRVRRKTLLRAREATLNECLRRVDQAPIVIEEWTGNPVDDDNLMQFVWTNYIKPSARVKRALENCDRTLTHRCAFDCSCNGASTSTNACNCQKSKTTHKMKIAAVECFTECGCTVASCPSRVLQRGRQHPVLIIRHPIKGWTSRTLETMPADTFVSEYTCEVLTAWQNAQRKQTYSIDLPDVMVDTSKESNFEVRTRRGRGNRRWKRTKTLEDGYYHREFVATALYTGNESRFFAHDCEPNMEIGTRYLDRYDFSYSHLGFFTTEVVALGKELTWNYHGQRLIEARKTGKPFKSAILPRCACRAGPKCMIKDWDLCTPSDDEESEDDQIAADSFSDDDKTTNEERIKKQLQSRSERSNRRLKMREEEPSGSSSPGSSVENDTPATSE